jgi:hypothetical protein
MMFYRYVGPTEIAARVRAGQQGTIVRSPQDVRDWAQETRQDRPAGCVIATYVVDQRGLLLIADRRSEHVACAGGQPVQSAGEITFEIDRGAVVTAISNQSTGYCPEPESWPAVSAALALAGLSAPDGFTLACDFRRCPKCAGINLIKDGVFACDVCGADLPAGYNVQG